MNGPLAVVVLATGVSAGGMPVYKCEEKGVITYTDRPCSAESGALELRAPIVTVAPTASERALAQAWDRRTAGVATARDRDDAEWLKQHAQRRDREARVEKAIVEHRVIKGMTTQEVRSAMGEPERIAGGDSFGSAKESWTYRDGGSSRTVNFKDGEVISTTGRTGSARTKVKRKP